jgi:hypothetical protein
MRPGPHPEEPRFLRASRRLAARRVGVPRMLRNAPLSRRGAQLIREPYRRDRPWGANLHRVGDTKLAGATCGKTSHRP